MIKKILFYSYWVFLYFLYFLLTIKERNEYLMAQSKGMDCIGSKDVSWFFPGGTTEYSFNPNSPPTRSYSTWKEFIERKQKKQGW